LKSDTHDLSIVGPPETAVISIADTNILTDVGGGSGEHRQKKPGPVVDP